jgi:hypothetical protein
MKAVQPRHASAQCQPSIHQASRPRTYPIPIYNNNRPIRHSTPTPASCCASSNTTVLPGTSSPIILPHRWQSRLRSVTTQKARGALHWTPPRRTRLHVRAGRVPSPLSSTTRVLETWKMRRRNYPFVLPLQFAASLMCPLRERFPKGLGRTGT